MDLELYSAIVSTLAVVLITLEWSYVILWTRKVGPKILAGIINALTNLRAGRGKGPTAAERISEVAENGPLTAPGAPEGLGIPDALIKRAAAAFGVSEDVARSYAQQFLGSEAGAPAAPADVFSALASKVAGGAKLTDEEKKAGLGMLFRQFLAGAGKPGVPPPGAASAEGSPGGFWV